MPSSAVATTSTRGREQLLQLDEPPHTRSTAVRAREEAARAHEQHEDHRGEEERRQVLALVRRQRAAEEPAREADREAAERRRDRPVQAAEHDAGEHDDRVAQREVRRDERRLHGQHHGDDGGERARDEHGDADHAVRAHAEQPRRLRSPSTRRACAGRSSSARAAACSATRQTTATTIATIVILRMSTPRDRHRPVEVGERASRSSRAAPNQSSAMLCSRNATANVATSITAGDCAAQRPEDEPVHRDREREHDGEAEDDPRPDRPAPLRRERERERAGHHELAVREVDEPQHAEDEADPDRHQRVDRAERESRRRASASRC